MGWAITLGILFLLAVLPLGVDVVYNAAGLILKIVAGPVKLQILPAKKKEKKKEEKPKPQKKKAAKPTPPKEEKPKEAGGSLQDFLPLVRIGLQLLDGFRRKLRFNYVELNLILAGDDPCDLATNYGKTWAAVGNLWPQLERCFVIKKRDVRVQCDFEAAQTVIIAHGRITITLGRLLGLVLYHGVRAVVAFIKIRNSKKAV